MARGKQWSHPCARARRQYLSNLIKVFGEVVLLKCTRSVDIQSGTLSLILSAQLEPITHEHNATNHCTI